MLEYGLQINSMVQQGIEGDATAAAASTVGEMAAPSDRRIGSISSSRMNSETQHQQRISQELAALSASFAQLERRMVDASMTVDDCRAAAVGSTSMNCSRRKVSAQAPHHHRRSCSTGSNRRRRGKDGVSIADLRSMASAADAAATSPDSVATSPQSAAASK